MRRTAQPSLRSGCAAGYHGVNFLKKIMPVDMNGKKVVVGAMVKVLHIDPKITEYLPDEEVRDINSMLNQVLKVYEIDKYDCEWVEKLWQRGEGQTESHSLSLSSNEMELVQNASS